MLTTAHVHNANEDVRAPSGWHTDRRAFKAAHALPALEKEKVSRATSEADFEVIIPGKKRWLSREQPSSRNEPWLESARPNKLPYNKRFVVP
jgi:hypothetical protein